MVIAEQPTVLGFFIEASDWANRRKVADCDWMKKERKGECKNSTKPAVDIRIGPPD